ncbi:MAG: hypothetical protein ACRDPQ_02730 [Nocardioidaceae bacterium]
MAASIGAAIGGPPGAIIGAAVAPGMTEVARRVGGEFARHRDRSAAGVVDAAATDMGVNAEGIDAKIQSTPGGLELAGEAVWAGWQTLNEQKVRALGRALANGLRDDGARIDQERLIIAALADLEAPHIKLLDYMARQGSEGFFFTIDHWAHGSRQSRSAIVVLMAALHRHGLVGSNEAMQNEESDEWLGEVVDKEVQRIDTALYALVEGHPLPASATRPLEHRRQPDLTIKWRVTEFGVTCAQYLRPRPKTVEE